MNSTEVQNRRRKLMLIIIGWGDWWFFQWFYACFMYSILLLPVQSLLKCFRSFHACHMCSVVFLPVYSLFKCHACHMCSTLFLPVQSLLMHVFQKLSLPALRTLSLSSLTLTQTVRLFNVSLRSQAPQQQYTVLSFDAKAWPRSQTDFSTCTTVLHCGHTFLNLS